MDDLLNNNPILNDISQEKLDFIRNFSQMEKPSSMKDAMPFLLANMNLAKKQNINFSKQEIQLIAELLSKNLSSSEKAKINRIISMMIK